jgi:hypothetical protein
MRPLRVLLEHAVDYAGLFPPAELDMRAAVGNYADYLASPDRWALGRFVVPLGRLAELEQAAADLVPKAPSRGAWPLAVLLSAGAPEEIEKLGEFNCRHAAEGAGAMSGDVVEVKAGSVEALERIMATVPRYLTVYVEIPLLPDPAPLVSAAGRLGARAKVRTGGVTAESFPAPAELVRFIRACTDAAVPFKATAGLHHPLRAAYRLTYEPGSDSGLMYGYLNVFLVAALLRQGASDSDAARLLEERDPAAIRVSDTGLEWEDYRLDLAALERTRSDGIVSFGSCSFTEPVGELRALELIP